MVTYAGARASIFVTPPGEHKGVNERYTATSGRKFAAKDKSVGLSVVFSVGCPMASSRSLKCMCLVLGATALMPAAMAKDKGPLLPIYVLQARTVTVLIDTDAGMSLSDPNANQTAQKDVETALLKWGRFQTVLSPGEADIVIVLRKGTGKLADATVNDPRQNRRPGSVTSTDGAVAIGVQHGPPPQPGDAPGQPQMPGPELHPQAEVGAGDDSFVVYRGHTNEPANSVAAWRYVHKNALHSHDVPAVDEFRKALQAAERQAAQQKP